MWTEKQNREAETEIGRVTIGGNPTAVETRGEIRNLPVYGPGGYFWTPKQGDRVLVIKGGPGGEEQCVAGTRQGQIPDGMGPGEVYLFTPGGNSVYLQSDGSIRLEGDIRIQGSLTVNGEPYKPCEC